MHSSGDIPSPHLGSNGNGSFVIDILSLNSLVFIKFILFQKITFPLSSVILKMISEELIVGKVDESTLMFDKKSIYKITDDKGNLLFTNNKKLMDSKDFDFIELATKVQERQKTLSPSEKFLQSLVLSIGGCLIVFMFLSLYLQQRF